MPSMILRIEAFIECSMPRSFARPIFIEYERLLDEAGRLGDKIVSE
jgi:hypothetical protein